MPNIRNAERLSHQAAVQDPVRQQQDEGAGLVTPWARFNLSEDNVFQNRASDVSSGTRHLPTH